MSKNSIVFNNAVIYLDSEPVDFHLLKVNGVHKLVIDTDSYNSTKRIRTTKSNTSSFRSGSVGARLVEAGLSLNNPVTLNFGDYNTKTIHSAVKRMGFKHASVVKTNKKGVYTVSCSN